MYAGGTPGFYGGMGGFSPTSSGGKGGAIAQFFANNGNNPQLQQLLASRGVVPGGDYGQPGKQPGGMQTPPPAGPVKGPGSPLGGGMPQGGIPPLAAPVGTIPMSRERMMQSVMQGAPPGMGSQFGVGQGGTPPGMAGGMSPGMALQQQMQNRSMLGGPQAQGASRFPASVRALGGYGGNSSYWTDLNPAGAGNPVFV